MKVKELIKILKNINPDKEIYIETSGKTTEVCSYENKKGEGFVLRNREETNKDIFNYLLSHEKSIFSMKLPWDDILAKTRDFSELKKIFILYFEGRKNIAEDIIYDHEYEDSKIKGKCLYNPSLIDLLDDDEFEHECAPIESHDQMVSIVNYLNKFFSKT